MRRIACLIALFLLAMMVFVPISPAQSTQTEQDIQRAIDETEALRGLELTNPVEVIWQPVEEAKQALIENIDEEFPPEDTERAQRLYVMLGLMEKGQSLKDILKDIVCEQMSFYYEPEGYRLTLLGDGGELTVENRLNLATMVLYALQSQHFNTDQPPLSNLSDTNNDASNAIDCLTAGDASLTIQQLMEKLTADEQKELVDAYANYETPLSDKAPQVITDSINLPFDDGANFVNYLYEEGGFNAINQAYKEPPVSTEQIMHPERYLAGEKPDQVSCKDVLASLGDKWELADTNVLGEFDIYELLLSQLQSSEASRGAEGWGGCQYHFYEKASYGQKMLVSDIAWDTLDDMEEFATLFGKYTEKRFGLKAGSFEWQDGWAVWRGGEEGTAALSVDGDHTCIVLSTDEASIGGALAGLGSGDPMLRDALDSYNSRNITLEEQHNKKANWPALVISLGILLIGLVAGIVMLLVTRKERASQAVVYPAYRQQPPWPPQPPYPPYPGGPGGGPGGESGWGQPQAWPGQAWQAQSPWPPPQSPGLQYPQQQEWPPQAPVTPQAREPGRDLALPEEGPVEES